MRPLGRPFRGALAAHQSGASFSASHALSDYSKQVGANGQLNMSTCGWYFLDPRTDTAATLDLCHFYTFTNEKVGLRVIGSAVDGVARPRLVIACWNLTSGDGDVSFVPQPKWPGWVFCAFSAPTSSGTPAYGYYSMLNEDRWHVAASASLTAAATKPDQANGIGTTRNSKQAIANWRVFNWSLTLDEWRLEKWRTAPSRREYAWFDATDDRVVDLVGAKTATFSSSVTYPIAGPVTQHEMLARRRRRTPLDYRFASPSADVSNSGWTRVP